MFNLPFWCTSLVFFNKARRSAPQSIVLNALILGALLKWPLMLHAAALPLVPADATAVLETFAPRVKRPPDASRRDPQQAAALARAEIALARSSTDPRHLGRAQSLLAPWWDRTDAPASVAILQATIQQSRHEFSEAQTVLERVLRADPAQPQAWLTLATLLRVAGRYEQSQTACSEVQRHGGGDYGLACHWEVRSLLGEHDVAQQGFAQLLSRCREAGRCAWLHSLKAEAEERAGRDAQALRSYEASLRLESDIYTALALADLHIRLGQPARAVATLASQPDSDAVLLRRAQARKMLGQGQWRDDHKLLTERFAALAQRGDDPQRHAREQALMYLWLDEDPRRALIAATLNLQAQREPFDWWLILEAARASGDQIALRALEKRLLDSGLKDRRLSASQRGSSQGRPA